MQSYTELFFRCGNTRMTRSEPEVDWNQQSLNRPSHSATFSPHVAIRGLMFSASIWQRKWTTRVTSYYGITWWLCMPVGKWSPNNKLFDGTICSQLGPANGGLIEQAVRFNLVLFGGPNRRCPRLHGSNSTMLNLELLVLIHTTAFDWDHATIVVLEFSHTGRSTRRILF